MSKMPSQCPSCYCWSTGTCINCRLDTAREGEAVPHTKFCTTEFVPNKQGGTKHDTGKPALSLIPRVALEAEARVFGLGAVKYERFNFKKGFKYSRLIDAALRHIIAFNDGEDLDLETKESHLAHARCCLAMLLDTISLGTAEDDRFKKESK